MNTLEILLLAFGLAMDAFAVSVSVGTTEFLQNKRARFRIFFHFGLFQGLMPILGWLAGNTIEFYIKAFDHWIAFALLAYVGGKMIKEGFENRPKVYCIDPSKGWNLVLLSIATSIDALAVGLGLAFLGTDIWYPAVLIGFVTAGLSLLGILMGSQIGSKIGKKVELVGGIVLLLIGIKIILEHTL